MKEALNPDATKLPRRVFLRDSLHTLRNVVLAGATAEVFSACETATGNGCTYTVQSGDTMSSIAVKSHESLQQLENDNPQITDPSLIHPGDKINVPGCPTQTPTEIPSSTPSNKNRQSTNQNENPNGFGLGTPLGMLLVGTILGSILLLNSRDNKK